MPPVVATVSQPHYRNIQPNPLVPNLGGLGHVYHATKDLYLTQRFARRASPLTTTAYTHPTD